jgi:hypothetical protein
MAEVSNEVLATRLDALTSEVNKLEAKLDAYASHFVSAEVYNLRHRELDLRIQSLEAKIGVINRTAPFTKALVATLSAAAGIILAFLVQFYLSHHG